MPNIKSQIKRTRTNEQARQDNASKKSELRTATKKVEALVAEGKKVEAETALREVISLLDRAAQQGVITRNSADRKKAHLQALVGGLN
ncbi:MAG: 30S ribosomal protein S20 [Bacilli bacterium]|nr:30S ribosomal protein S20 [Bacilli bacterium]